MSNTVSTSDGEGSPGMEAQDMQERRRSDRTRDDADWESKVIGRLNGRLHHLPVAESKNDEPSLGWEATVLDVLRKRIERESK